MITATCLNLSGYWEELRSCFRRLELLLEHKGLEEIEWSHSPPGLRSLNYCQEEKTSARKDNTEKNLDVSFGSLTLLVWVVYLRSWTKIYSFKMSFSSFFCWAVLLFLLENYFLIYRTRVVWVEPRREKNKQTKSQKLRVFLRVSGDDETEI